ncbi:MAG: hypothetical protein ABIW33_01690 [Sphingomicrobium sp.]
MTADRQLFGDVALAMLLVFPTAAIAGSQLPTQRQVAQALHSSASAKIAPSDRSMAEHGVNLLS